MADPLADSYYAATASPWPAQPALAGDHRCDVAVIGGGFTGLSAALACAEKGMSVILLEAQKIGFGASGRNGGQLIPGLRWNLSRLEKELGKERAQALFDLCWKGPSRVVRRIERHGIGCDLKRGHFEAAWTLGDFDEMRREADWLAARYGYETAAVDRGHVGAHVASAIYHGGIYDPNGGHFHPLNYAIGLARAAHAAGAKIHEQSRAIRIEDGAKVIVHLPGATVRCSHAILAADAWMGEIAPDLAGHTVPIMNYNVATAPLPRADALLPSDAAVADSRFVLNYFRLSADKRLLFGGGEKYVQRPPADIAGFVRRHIVEVFPSLSDVEVDFAWGGRVAVTMNRLPRIGRRGNVFHAFGFSGHGALVTTLAGELIADALAGDMSGFDVMAALPGRPFPGGPLLARPLATLGLFWYALRDRL